MQQLIAWWFFTVKGWKTKGRFPFELKKAVYIVAPHTHSTDFFLGLAVRKKMHFEFIRFLGKKELFVPPFSWILHYLGCYPVDRSKNNNFVEQVVKIFNEKETFHLALSPEGTRKKVYKLRSETSDIQLCVSLEDWEKITCCFWITQAAMISRLICFV